MDTTRALPTLWPCLNFRDAHRAVAFLRDAFGFRLTLMVDGDDDCPVTHAELLRPDGAGIILGSAAEDRGPFKALPTGAACVYLVTDDPDGEFARATAAGGRVVVPLRDEEYGSRGFTVADAEGNLWSLGTYPGSTGTAS